VTRPHPYYTKEKIEHKDTSKKKSDRGNGIASKLLGEDKRMRNKGCPSCATLTPKQNRPITNCAMATTARQVRSN